MNRNGWSALTETGGQIQPKYAGYGYMYAQALPASPGTDIEWAGWLEPSLILNASAHDPIIRVAAEEASERFSVRFSQRLAHEMPARFFRGADGVLRVEQSFPLSGGGEVLVEGEQISRDVIEAHG